MGLTVDLVNENIFAMPSILLPAIVELKTDRVAGVIATGDDYVSVLFPEVSQTVDTKIPYEEFAEQITSRIALLNHLKGSRIYAWGITMHRTILFGSGQLYSRKKAIISRLW